MAWSDCDVCNQSTYTEDNPFVEYRTQRPSDHACMTCTMAGHQKCFNAETLPSIGETGGIATPQQWEDWIEKEGMKLGYLWLD